MRFHLEFLIPMLPKTYNQVERMHLFARRTYVKEIHEIVWAKVGGKKPPQPLPRARLTLTRFSSVEPDSDGLVSSFKHVIDGLVECGVLVNDRFSNIGMPDYRWSKVKPKQGAIHVVVEEISDG